MTPGDPDSGWPGTDPARALPPQPPPSRVVGGYELQEELGRGAMGVVHRAVDRRGGREVALELVLGADERPERRERFTREALLLASLSHPASMLEEGEGVPRDVAGAAALFRQAAERGHAPATVRLARLLHRGAGVAQDRAAARRWLERAAAEGDADARHVLERGLDPE